jgi:hypothetical protein
MDIYYLFVSRAECTVSREAVELNSALRRDILSKLLSNFGGLKFGKVMRGALWIIGEYCTEPECTGLNLTSRVHAGIMI